MSSQREGGCACGEFRYRLASEPLFVHCCHCLNCKAFALFFSTLTDSPLGATMGALAVLVASSLLFTLDAASPIAPYLPTRYWLAFVDFFRDPILWRDVVRGIALQGVYVGVLLAAAWANFTTKDITS